MRGPGQIAELAAIAEPDIAVITNVGPGPRRAARLDRGDRGGEGGGPGRPARGRAPRSCRSRPASSSRTSQGLGAGALIRFGARRGRRGGGEPRRRRGDRGARSRLPRAASSSTSPSPRPTTSTNALAAVAAGSALGAPLGEMADRAANIGFSRFRGERLELGDGIVLVNDCYNANPVSMRAALDHLASAGRGAADRRARGDGGARPGRRGLSPRDRRRMRAGWASTC